MKFRLISHETEDAAWHLALEEALFLKSKEDLLKGKFVQPIVRLYSFAKPSVILGYKQKIDEIDKEFCAENDVRVTMRSTGGGSVFLSPEELQYSLILPLNYSKNLLKEINMKIINALKDSGFHANIKNIDNHSVVRLNDKSFVFDAERRFLNLLLHHGTVLVDNKDYDKMPNALRANHENIHDMATGNLWLREIQEIKKELLVKTFEKNLSNNDFIKKGFTNDELKLAKELYDKFYNNKEVISSGKKKFGICYLPSTIYNMERYTRKDGI
tara:strand:- start:10524 stop:11336 length:813 start_codon:yes stop_codon:yes gene_type:complete